jgi:predicted outer membrane lipoprotein
MKIKSLLLFLFSLVLLNLSSFAESVTKEVKPQSLKDSVELNVNINVNSSELIVSKIFRDESHVKQYLDKSLQNDSVFLEEIKGLSSSITSSLTTISDFNLLEANGFTKQCIDKAIHKDFLITNISLVLSFLLAIAFLIINALTYDIMDRSPQTLMTIIYAVLLSASLFFIFKFSGTMWFNKDLLLIEQILRYKL